MQNNCCEIAMPSGENNSTGKFLLLKVVDNCIQVLYNVGAICQQSTELKFHKNNLKDPDPFTIESEPNIFCNTIQYRVSNPRPLGVRPALFVINSHRRALNSQILHECFCKERASCRDRITILLPDYPYGLGYIE